MAQISRSRTVAASAQQVWDVLADFGAISSWVGSVDHSCLLEHGRDGVAVGTSRRVQVGRDTLVERITVFDEPVALAYTIEGLPRPLGRVANRWTLTQDSPAADLSALGLPASTTVTLTTTVQIGANPLASLAERALCRLMSKQSDALLAGLSARVEGH